MRYRKIVIGLMIGLSSWMFTGCGGGGSSGVVIADEKSIDNNNSIVLNDKTFIIDSNLSSNIKGLVFDDSNSTYRSVSVSESLSNTLKQGEIFYLPAGMDDRFPLGLTGKIEEVNNGNVQLSKVELADVVTELKLEDIEGEFTPEDLISVIVPPGTEPTTQAKSKELRGLNKNKKSFLDGGIVFESTPNKNLRAIEIVDTTKKLLKQTITLNLKIANKLPMTATGTISNLVYRYGADIGITSGIAFKTNVSGNLNLDLKFQGNTDYPMGYSKKDWDNLSKINAKDFGIDAEMTGISGDDKLGKMPIIGLVFALKEVVSAVASGGATAKNMVLIGKDIDKVDKVNRAAAIVYPPQNKIPINIV